LPSVFLSAPSIWSCASNSAHISRIWNLSCDPMTWLLSFLDIRILMNWLQRECLSFYRSSFILITSGIWIMIYIFSSSAYCVIGFFSKGHKMFVYRNFAEHLVCFEALLLWSQFRTLSICLSKYQNSLAYFWVCFSLRYICT
jgi:hypothetical protein